MDNVKISLPKPENTTGKRIISFLKQFELSIHHLQKSVEQMEKDGELSENTYIMYRFPFLENQRDNDHYVIKDDDLSDTFAMQDVELEIATA